MHGSQIMTLLRTGQSADALIQQDAGILAERVISRTSVKTIRAAVVTYLNELYGEVVPILRREHVMRVRSNMDGATARSHWRVLRTLVADIGRAGAVDTAMAQRIKQTLEAIPMPAQPEDDGDEEGS